MPPAMLKRPGVRSLDTQATIPTIRHLVSYVPVSTAGPQEVFYVKYAWTLGTCFKKSYFLLLYSLALCHYLITSVHKLPVL